MISLIRSPRAAALPMTNSPTMTPNRTNRCKMRPPRFEPGRYLIEAASSRCGKPAVQIAALTLRSWRDLTAVMAGHSRPKDGVASARLCPGHPRLCPPLERKTWMPGTSPGMTRALLRQALPRDQLQAQPYSHPREAEPVIPEPRAREPRLLLRRIFSAAQAAGVGD